MDLDPRMILTIAGMLVSVVSSFVIVRQKLGAVAKHVGDIETRLRKLDSRVDKTEITDQRVSTLASMLAPGEREKFHREIATMSERLSALHSDVSALKSMHNGKHPPVASERIAT